MFALLEKRSKWCKWKCLGLVDNIFLSSVNIDEGIRISVGLPFACAIRRRLSVFIKSQNKVSFIKILRCGEFSNG